MSLSVFITTYASPLSALAAWGITSIVIIWQINRHSSELKKELKALIQGARREDKTDTEEPRSGLMTATQNAQGISPPPAYTTAKSLPGASEIIAKWTGDIIERALTKIGEEIARGLISEADIAVAEAIPNAEGGDLGQERIIDVSSY